MCPDCRAKHDAWLDARMPPPRPQIATHAGYDGTPAGMMERRRARADDWTVTVRHAQQVIRDNCTHEAT